MVCLADVPRTNVRVAPGRPGTNPARARTKPDPLSRIAGFTRRTSASSGGADSPIARRVTSPLARRKSDGVPLTPAPAVPRPGQAKTSWVTDVRLNDEGWEPMRELCVTPPPDAKVERAEGRARLRAFLDQVITPPVPTPC